MNSNLPPGCTGADIEHAFGDQFDVLEAFKASQKGKLTTLQEEQLNWGELEENVSIVDLIEKFFVWARDFSRQDFLEDEGMYAQFLIELHINPVLIKTYEAVQAEDAIAQITRWVEKTDFTAVI